MDRYTNKIYQQKERKMFYAKKIENLRILQKYARKCKTEKESKKD